MFEPRSPPLVLPSLVHDVKTGDDRVGWSALVRDGDSLCPAEKCPEGSGPTFVFKPMTPAEHLTETKFYGK